jgi:site-specific DNA-methyltransferase (adenine-specific)
MVGNCRELMRGMAEASVDAIVTDPPYHLTQASRGGSPRQNDPATPFGRTKLGSKGFMGKTWDGGNVAFDPEIWAQCLRVLKPGGHLLAFGGARTYHRLACAIEDAGFEIRDQVQWIYGSGFPKSRDVSKAIDEEAGAERTEITCRYKATGTARTMTGGNYGGGGNNIIERNEILKFAPVTDAARQWQGWGTALKPAHEPIVLARKPLIGTVAQNVQAFGTGALNIDGCLVGTTKDVPASPRKEQDRIYGRYAAQNGSEKGHDANIGRWPANIIHDGSDEVEEAFAAQSNVTKSTGGQASKPKGFGEFGGGSREIEKRDPGFGDIGTASRFFYCSKASKADREDGLEGMPEVMASELTNRAERSAGLVMDDGTRPNGKKNPYAGTSGEVRRNPHPTVKPTTLMRYLCRLITPPSGTVLDPFAGSGSTGRGAVIEGFNFIGIELDPEYAEIARKRIAAAAARRRTAPRPRQGGPEIPSVAAPHPPHPPQPPPRQRPHRAPQPLPLFAFLDAAE